MTSHFAGWLLLLLVSLCSLPMVAQNNIGDPFSGSARSSSDMASTYVPLDSWIYPTLERFEALGYLQTGILGLRPWTRLECTRLVMEIDELSGGELPNDLQRQYRDLKVEFAPDLNRLQSASNRSAELESTYYRNTWIAGSPLNDGYHFAQTIANNFGRPYGNGNNLYAGGAARATARFVAVYVSGEYQRSTPGISLSTAAQQAVAQADFTPLPAESPA